MNVEDYARALEISSGLLARETRLTGTTDRCSSCGQDVALLEDKCPRLTSSGTAFVWRTRKPEAHSDQCWAEFKERVRALPYVDLWGCA